MQICDIDWLGYFRKTYCFFAMIEVSELITKSEKAKEIMTFVYMHIYMYICQSVLSIN